MALIAAAVALTIVVAVVLITSSGEAEDGSASSVADCREVEKPEPKTVALDPPKAGQVLRRGEPASAVVETNCGSFTIELDTERAPKTANSFAYLAEQKAFDGTWFHRIVPDFVFQGGDPKGDGTGGPGYSIEEAPPEDLSYEPGLVAMAKTATDPSGTSGSQFFVVTGQGGSSLTPDYALVGRVIEGMDVVDKIAGLGDANQQPTATVVIDSVTVERG